jgi:murein DD-endopeptidase MepM/ murein hydrolase activator NlpD
MEVLPKMSNQYKKLLSSFCLMLLFITAIFPAYGDELNEKQQELDDINRQINQQQSNLDRTTQQQNNILKQIQSLDSSMNKTQKDINATSYSLSQLKDSIKQSEQDIQKKQVLVNQQTDLLGERLVYIYEDGMVSYLGVLLSANSLNDFLIRFDMLKAIVDEDVRLIESINRERQNLSMRKADLEVKMNQIENTQLVYQQQQNDLLEQKNSKKVLLGSVEQEKDKYEQALNELEQSSKEIENYIRSRSSGSSGGSAKGTGKFTWPIPGYKTISSAFGMRYHPILKTRKLHTGEDISAVKGATIVAADSGTVILAGWQTGYGKTTIIDHGNGITTLYGHQDDWLVSEGDVVKKGQPIGKADSTGWSTGHHLHFEVRKNGTPVSPLSYL